MTGQEAAEEGQRLSSAHLEGLWGSAPAGSLHKEAWGGGTGSGSCPQGCPEENPRLGEGDGVRAISSRAAVNQALGPRDALGLPA